jgi:hypothetical protein
MAQPYILYMMQCKSACEALSRVFIWFWTTREGLGKEPAESDKADHECFSQREFEVGNKFKEC